MSRAAALLTLALAGRAAAAGIDVPPRGTLTLPSGPTTGPLRLHGGARIRAAPGAVLSAPDGKVVVASEGEENEIVGLSVRARGEQSGIQLRGGSLALREVRVAAERGSAILVSEGRLSARGIAIDGGDYGVLAYRGEVDLEGGSIERVRRAGVALVRTTGRIARMRLVGPFGDAALSALASPKLSLERNEIAAAGSIGIKILSSTATLAHDRVAGAKADARGLEGDGLYLFQSEVSSSGDRIEGSGGNGVVVLGGRAAIRDCVIERSGDAAAWVDERGRLSLTRCAVRGAALGLHVEPGSEGTAPGTTFRELREVPPEPRTGRNQSPPAPVER